MLAFIITNAIAAVLLVLALIKDRKRAVNGLKVAIKIGSSMVALLLIIMIAISFIIGFAPAGVLPRLVGGTLGFLSVPLIALLGSLLALPAPVIFPIAAMMLKNMSGAGGAGVVGVAAIAAFITCNTMVSMGALPIEVKMMGSRSTIVRQSCAFVAALSISLIMGVLLSGYHI